MPTEIGEFFVGAYLKEVENCSFVDYNVRPPGGGVKGLGELDVVGLRFEDSSAHLCEVATHLGGLEYGRGYEDSAERIARKFSRARAYAAESLQSFPNVTFSFWAPRVPKGKLLGLLTGIEGLRLVINEDYTARVEELREVAASTRKDTGNPFFRAMQLLEHLRR